jgi:hypothetical protein
MSVVMVLIAAAIVIVPHFSVNAKFFLTTFLTPHGNVRQCGRSA